MGKHAGAPEEPPVKRLIASGYKPDALHTRYVKFATSDPAWKPRPDPNAEDIDYDSLAKIDLEEREDDI